MKSLVHVCKDIGKVIFSKENFPSVTKFPLRDISFSINKYKTI